jgi:hypothetical protein
MSNAAIEGFPPPPHSVLKTMAEDECRDETGTGRLLTLDLINPLNDFEEATHKP